MTSLRQGYGRQAATALKPVLSPLERFVLENRSLNAAYSAARAEWRAGFVAFSADAEWAREQTARLVVVPEQPAGRGLSAPELSE